MTKVPDLKERIERQMKARKPTDVKELNLDGCKAESLEAVTSILEECYNLEDLSLVLVGISTLRDFPKLPKLRKLNLSDNRISGGLHHVASGCPSLEKLIISNNRIKDMATLEPLKTLSSLTFLDMFDCEISRSENYRQKIYDFLPQLKDLDGLDKDERETKESDDEESGDENESYSDEPDEEDRENGVEDEEGGDGEEDGVEYEPGSGTDSAEEEAVEATDESAEERRGLKRRNDDTTGSDS